MAETYQRITRSHSHPHDYPVETEHEYHEVVDNNPGITRAQLIVQYIITVLSGLLFVRFILALFGANAANFFVNMVYTITAPFVAPFKGIFSLDTTSGLARFEVETLVAIIVYILAGLGVIRLLDVFRK